MINQFRSSGAGFSLARERQLRKLLIINFFFIGFLLLAGIVFVMVHSSTGEARQSEVAAVTIEKEPAIQNVDVLVPVRSINAGTEILPSMFRIEPRPISSVGERAVRDFTEVQGLYSRSIIFPGEPLTRDVLTEVKPSNNVVAQSIPEGYRAVTISVDAKTGVEGWARPGARVDIAWTSNVLGKPGLTVIVQNALVVSAERQVDPRADPNTPMPSTVTLLATAKDSAKIQLAQVTGALTLSLRGEGDKGTGNGFSDITVYDLLGRPSNEDAAGQSVEGFARFKHKNGKTEEMVIVNGQIRRRNASSISDISDSEF
jgi:pilus assembly protein CpaB